MTVLTLDQIDSRPIARITTGLPWFDSITGGGLVPGSVTLMHGGPGAGKSTALAQVAGFVPGSLYVTLEEDLRMVADRFRRVGADRSCRLTNDENEIGSATGLVIVDSLQLTADGALDTARTAAEVARTRGIAVILVCHETKSGGYAGPGTLEHLVDVTLRLQRQPRWIVCEKNRFGPAGVYLPLVMTEGGLRYERGN